MKLPLLGKVAIPLSWTTGAIAIGAIAVGGVLFALDVLRNREDLDALTVTVTRQDLVVRIEASGTIVPDKNVNVSPKTAGRLERLFVDQGDLVERGQKLAEMENDELEALFLQAQANLQEAIASLDEAEAGTRAEEVAQARARFDQARASLERARERIPREIDQAEARVASARARFNLAEERRDRNNNLLTEGAISQDGFDEIINEYRSAEADLSEARQRLEEVRNTTRPEVDELAAAEAEARAAWQQAQNGPRVEEIARLRAAVTAARAQLQAAESNYRDTTILAPFAGVITQKYATEGAFVTPTTSASTTASATSTSIVAIASGLEVLAKVPEVDVGLLRPGQAVEIVADAYPDRIFTGRIERVAPEAVVEENVTSFEVRIKLDAGMDVLRSNMNADVTFIGETIDGAVVVPTVAIVTREGEAGVLAVGIDDEPDFRAVVLGPNFDTQTQILNGIAPGDRVFIDLPDK
ncbi:multidrug resistance efflux pump [Rubidibacter lacunae KORDI 51-2]|uniref:Multidrug resistance efflux pump n=1 Tax=Rubidibacter lacunae KORDI 51-2 TaxID=582515 RepID=U5DHD5_9CHRO|nr:efflux RND transporter periplasmic adaptor subunit [Rubidibacter lacunae]ERN39984.1 multidrug resistance efflux pump [Rubidibacter lacunae KORDI 51-2]